MEGERKEAFRLERISRRAERKVLGKMKMWSKGTVSLKESDFSAIDEFMGRQREIMRQIHDYEKVRDIPLGRFLRDEVLDAIEDLPEENDDWKRPEKPQLWNSREKYRRQGFLHYDPWDSRYEKGIRGAKKISPINDEEVEEQKKTLSLSDRRGHEHDKSEKKRSLVKRERLSFLSSPECRCDELLCVCFGSPPNV